MDSLCLALAEHRDLPRGDLALLGAGGECVGRDCVGAAWVVGAGIEWEGEWFGKWESREAGVWEEGGEGLDGMEDGRDWGGRGRCAAVWEDAGNYMSRLQWNWSTEQPWSGVACVAM